MMAYRDTTFCASPNCKNDCGRQISTKDHEIAKEHAIAVCYGYFCGEPTEPQGEKNVDFNKTPR
jgi:hypothetical protein